MDCVLNRSHQNKHNRGLKTIKTGV
uniref:Uncharacterized protein n=1 Tax=Arundo donax TaxID=35708 RepID=A0A0A9FKQ6_ARUDO